MVNRQALRLPKNLRTIQRSLSIMSAPSRRPEIRRRRTRKEKIDQLHKRQAAATTDAERTRIAAKLRRLSLASPGNPLLQT
jgi:hypothetical protein